MMNLTEMKNRILSGDYQEKFVYLYGESKAAEAAARYVQVIEEFEEFLCVFRTGKNGALRQPYRPQFRQGARRRRQH